MDLKLYLAERRSLVDRALERLVPAAERSPERLNAAMRYSLLGGGKRLRPILVLAAAEAVGGSLDAALGFACAMECIHTYSLIHDDLPAMDDDALRRGRPTCHVQYDEATAILAGDGLLTLAFELAAAPVAGVSAASQLAVIAQLAQDAGWAGMVGGQMLDLLAERRTVELEELQTIHRNKTAALIRCSCVAGAILGGGSAEQVAGLDRYGQAIGLAFQITDDILDEVGDVAELGKNPGADIKKAKATYSRLLGIPRARAAAEELIATAHASIAPFPAAAAPLRELASYVISRTS